MKCSVLRLLILTGMVALFLFFFRLTYLLEVWQDKSASGGLLFPWEVRVVLSVVGALLGAGMSMAAVFGAWDVSGEIEEYFTGPSETEAQVPTFDDSPQHDPL